MGINTGTHIRETESETSEFGRERVATEEVYNASGNMTSRIYTGYGSNNDVLYQVITNYDDEGNTTSIKTKEYSYDEKGKLISIATEIYSSTNGISKHYTRYDYSEDGKIKFGKTDNCNCENKLISSEGKFYDDSKLDFKIVFEYNAEGQITSVIGKKIIYSCDGRIDAIDVRNYSSDFEFVSGKRTKYSRDGNVEQTPLSGMSLMEMYRPLPDNKSESSRLSQIITSSEAAVFRDLGPKQIMISGPTNLDCLLMTSNLEQIIPFQLISKSVDLSQFKYIESLIHSDEDLLQTKIETIKNSICSGGYYDGASIKNLIGDGGSSIYCDIIRTAYDEIFLSDGSEKLGDLFDNDYSHDTIGDVTMSSLEFQLLATAALADTLIAECENRGIAFSTCSDIKPSYSIILSAVMGLHQEMVNSDADSLENAPVLQKLPGEAQGVVPVN